MKYGAKHSSPSARAGLRAVSVLLLLVLALPLAATAQTSSPERREEMSRLDFLLGEWKGKGWMFRVDGSRVELSQSTKVRSESDGSSLRVRDAKSYKGLAFDGSTLSQSLDANVYYDEGAKTYRWRRELERKNPFAARLIEPRTLQWEKPSPGSVARTTIRITEGGEWHETLEFRTGGADGWFKAQESVLKKVK